MGDIFRAVKMEVAESVELKFRLYDGTDIGPNKYAPATTVAALKERLLAQWPAGNENAPKTINDMKIINAGKILENNKTLADSRVVPIGEGSGSVITMHVVVRPTLTGKNNEKLEDPHKGSRCRCTIL